MHQRGRRLLVLLVGALVVTCLGATPAQAATSRSLSLATSSTTPTIGSSITLSGKLTKSPKGTLVTLQRRYSTTSSWSSFTSTRTTSSSGAFKKSVKPTSPRKTYYRATVKATSKLKVATSSTRTVDVRAKVTVSIAASQSSIVQGSSSTLSGTVTPRPTGSTTVTVQRLSGSTWVTAGTTTFLSTGAWSLAVSPSVTTTYRAITASRTGFATGASSSAKVTVTAPQTPLAVSSDALPIGVVGAAYSAQLRTADGRVGTWSLTSGSLPAGLTLSPSGAITGTPTTAGDSAATVSVTVGASTASGPGSISVEAEPTATPAQVEVAAGGSHTCRITTNGMLSCWGSNSKGQLGLGQTSITPGTPNYVYQPSPRALPSTIPWRSVAPSDDPVGSFTCGTRTDLTLWCWGDSTGGQLGDNGTGVYVESPKQVGIGTAWDRVVTGVGHGCATTVDDELWCWGGKGSGQALGATVPTQVGTDSDWTAISAGGYISCGLRGSGTLWCWGSNTRGQLGTGGPTTFDGSPTPVQVGSATDWQSIEVGTAGACGIRTGGTLWCWGRNAAGEVGDGTTGTDRTTPVQIGAGTTWRSVSAGGGGGNAGHTCAVSTSDALFCWGDGDDGQIGDGATTDRLVPTPSGSGSLWRGVTTGGSHSCGITTSSSILCWGRNEAGQLGVGAYGASRSTPVAVSG